MALKIVYKGSDAQSLIKMINSNTRSFEISEIIEDISQSIYFLAFEFFTLQKK